MANYQNKQKKMAKVMAWVLSCLMAGASLTGLIAIIIQYAEHAAH